MTQLLLLLLLLLRQQLMLLPRQALHSSRLELNLEGFPSFWEAPVPREFML